MKYTKYPATLGLIEWIYETRKNRSALGENESIGATAELLFSFTLPFAELEKLPEKELQARLSAFKAELGPNEFEDLGDHAKREIQKYFKTATTPKKKQAPPMMKNRRKR